MNHPGHDHVRYHNWRTLWWAVWCIVGTGVVVAAFYMGVNAAVNGYLRNYFEGHPFFLSPHAFAPAPLAVFMLSVAVTLFFVQVLLYTPGLFRRLFLWLSILVVAVLTTPVCAMWGIYFGTTSIVLSMLVAGFGACITALFLRPACVELIKPDEFDEDGNLPEADETEDNY